MLTAGEVRQFQQDGFLHIASVIQGEDLRRLQEASDRVMDEAIAYGKVLDAKAPPVLATDHGFWEWDEIDEKQFLYGRNATGERVWRRAQKMWGRDTVFRQVSVQPDVLGIVEDILGTADFLPGDDAMVTKMPGAGAAVPWHRDPPGQRLLDDGKETTRQFVMDIYVDHSIEDNGCLRAIPGSHRREMEIPDTMNFDRPDAVLLETAPGDILLHATAVKHGSTASESERLRRTFYVHYDVPETFQTQPFWDWSPDRLEAQRQLLRTMKLERAADLGALTTRSFS